MTNISTYEHTPIVFGSAGFAGPLTITNTGEIHPTADPGAIALYIPVHVAKPTLVNDGFVVAGKGVYTDGHIYNGGIGIKVGAAATITNAGDIAGGYGGNVDASAAGYGGVGVYIFAKSVKLNNSGEISGGGGGVGNHINRIGAIGVAVYAASAVTNSGMITGGEGGQGDYSTNANNGGDGVLLSNSARLTNSGTVIGGGGGFFFGTANAGIGGAGVYLNDATAINSGYIAGGRGGLEGGTGNGGAGGVGVAVLQGSFTNKGTVAGGAGYVGKGGISGDGGVGVVVYGSLASGSNVKAGVIIGGAGGTEVVTYMAGSPPNTYHIYSTAPGYALPGLEVGGGASFNNAGTVIGGASGATSNYNQNKAQPSGRGAVVSIGTLVNSGTISGGVAGQNIYGAYGLLGYEKAKLTNSGKIFGGAGGYGRDTGGDGVGLRNSSTLTSSGRITGGAGGYQYRLGGTGGFGMAIDDSSASNSGVITGGAGGGGYYYGGAGGAGVQIENGKFTNTGLVVGGAGSYGHYGSGAGGIGVVLTASGTEASLGATLVNAGTIRGSHGADAVLVGNVGGTVVAENGAVFDGNVVASNGSFELAGTGSTAMAGFGTKITGFTSVDFATGAKWVISGDIAGLASGQTINGFGVGDGIKITDAAAAGGTVIVKKAGVVTVEVQGGTTITLDIANAKAGATNYNFANDKLSESNAKAAMAFITPNAEPKAESVPGWTTGFTLPPQFYGFTAAPPIAVQTHLTAAITGGTHDLVLKPQHAFDAMVTLHAG